MTRSPPGKGAVPLAGTMIHTLGYADDLALVEDGDDFQQYLKGVLNLQGF